jgi:hypothetical protein
VRFFVDSKHGQLQKRRAVERGTMLKKKAKGPETQQEIQARIVKRVLKKLKAGKDAGNITQSLFGDFKFSDYRPLTEAIKELEGGRGASLPEWVGKDDREKIKALVKARPKIRRTRKLVFVLILLAVVGGICYKLFM